MSQGQKTGSVRYVRAPGSPFTDQQARVFGAALVAIAKSLGRDVQSLDKRDVFNWAKANRNTPLAKHIFKRGQASAAEAYYLSECGKVLRSIHIEIVHVGGKLNVPAKSVRLWTTSDAVPDRGSKPSRAAVIRPELLRSDPMMVSAIARKIREVDGAITGLERVILGYDAAPEVTMLAGTLRKAMSRYLQSMEEVSEAAQ